MNDFQFRVGFRVRARVRIKARVKARLTVRTRVRVSWLSLAWIGLEIGLASNGLGGPRVTPW